MLVDEDVGYGWCIIYMYIYIFKITGGREVCVCVSSCATRRGVAGIKYRIGCVFWVGCTVYGDF